MQRTILSVTKEWTKFWWQREIIQGVCFDSYFDFQFHIVFANSWCTFILKFLVLRSCKHRSIKTFLCSWQQINTMLFHNLSTVFKRWFTFSKLRLHIFSSRYLFWFIIFLWYCVRSWRELRVCTEIECGCLNCVYCQGVVYNIAHKELVLLKIVCRSSIDCHTTFM
jgi:hypothetical protein